jgi:hypothetical protein
MSAISYQPRTVDLLTTDVRRCVGVDLIGARVDRDPPTREEMLE